jgi:hypothetical protein
MQKAKHFNIEAALDFLRRMNTTKRPPISRRAFCCAVFDFDLGLLDVGSLEPFGTLGDVERNRIAFGE